MVAKEIDFPKGGQEPLTETSLLNLELAYRGKVRDTYRLPSLAFEADEKIYRTPERLLMIATDRVSAFDVVLPAGIPDKGKILNLMSAFWFWKTLYWFDGKSQHFVNNHMASVIMDTKDLSGLSAYGQFPDYLVGRSMIVRPAQRIDVECVVRGYLAGSAWAEYSKESTIHGQPAPSGLRESDQLPEAIFTPTTKADTGHDEPISLKDLANLMGSDLARQLEEKAIAVYSYATKYALSRGIIIADTKMEFGFIDGQLCLIDELLTPDSSRFWDAEAYSPGKAQPSFDKQYLRDYLIASGWNKEPPVPPIPEDVIQRTAEKYREAYRRLIPAKL